MPRAGDSTAGGRSPTTAVALRNRRDARRSAEILFAPRRGRTERRAITSTLIPDPCGPGAPIPMTVSLATSPALLRPPTDRVRRIDQAAFARDLADLKTEIDAAAGDEDVAHLRKMRRWSRGVS